MSLCGCAVRVFDVSLNTPQDVAAVVKVSVQDDRLDPQVYMTGIAYGSQTNIYLLAPKPPLNVTLQKFIEAGLPPSPSIKSSIVKIQRLDLKNRVGFGIADQLYCEIESTVQRQGSDQQALVKTFSKNMKNMSSFIDTAASVILQQCLEEHAKDIAQQLTKMQPVG